MWLAFVGAAVVQFFLIFSNLFNKLAAGMEPDIIVAYRYIFGFGTLFFYLLVSALGHRICSSFSSPSARRFEAILIKREECWLELNWKDGMILLGGAFLAALLGMSLFQNLNLHILSDLNPDWAQSLTCCDLIIMGFINLLFAYWKDLVAWRDQPVGLKLFAANLISIFIFSAAAFLGLYRGHVFFHSSRLAKVAAPSYTTNIHGVLMSVGGSISTALSFVIQAMMYKRYPDHYFLILTLTHFIGAIQATSYALSKCHSLESWKLGLDVNLLAVTYLGVVCSGIMIAITAFCVRRIGLELVSTFNPAIYILSPAPLVISNGELRVGSVLIGLLMIAGWLVIIWINIESKADQLFTDPQRDIKGSLPSNVDIELGINTDNETRGTI